MKSKIGFVCIGQAGGNIGQILEQHGYNCLFVNSSKEDLNTLNTKYRFHIEGGEGCNHDREKAIKLVKKHYRKVVEEIQDKLFYQQLIYLVFSTGGGTGSGSAPILLEALNSTMPTKLFGCITILPSLDEPLKAHMNAFRCYQELSSIEKLATVFTLDNEKHSNRFTLNNNFVSMFNTALNIPSHIDTRGNIDHAELWEMLSTRGNAIIATCNSSTNLTSSIIKSWEQNIFADIERDKSIVYLGLSLSSDVVLEDLKKYIGNPFDVFKNYNRDQTVTILSGLTFPKSRINRIIETLNNNKDTIKNNLINAKTNKIDTSIDWLNEVEKPTSKDKEININLDDIFSKY